MQNFSFLKHFSIFCNFIKILIKIDPKIEKRGPKNPEKKFRNSGKLRRFSDPKWVRKIPEFILAFLTISGDFRATKLIRNSGQSFSEKMHFRNSKFWTFSPEFFMKKFTKKVTKYDQWDDFCYFLSKSRTFCYFFLKSKTKKQVFCYFFSKK